MKLPIPKGLSGRLIRTLSLTLAFFTLLAAFGCSDIRPMATVTGDSAEYDTPPEKSDYPVSFGSESFDSSPGSIASLSPALTSVLLDLGAAERLVAVSDYCSCPGEPERIGSPALPDIDRIIELAPELLVTQSPIASADVIRLSQAGVRTLYLETPSSYPGLCQEYINLSMVLYGAVDFRDAALSALSELEKIMDSAYSAGISCRFAIIESYSPEGYTLLPSGSLASNMLTAFGSNAVGEDGDIYLDAQDIISLYPEVIFADTSLEGDIEEDGLESARVIYLDISAFSRPDAGLSSVMAKALSGLTDGDSA